MIRRRHVGPIAGFVFIVALVVWSGLDWPGHEVVIRAIIGGCWGTAVVLVARAVWPRWFE